MGNASASGISPADTAAAGDPLSDVAISALSESDASEWTLRVKRHYDVPVCFIALPYGSRLFLKGRHGIDAEFVDESSICHFEPSRELPVIMSNILDIPDCKYDPLVLGPPYARFYIGVPLASPGSKSLGTLCIMDTKPCKFFSLRNCTYMIECGRHIAEHLTRRLEESGSLTTEGLGSHVPNGGAHSSSSLEHAGARESLESADAAPPDESRALESLGSFHQAGTGDEVDTADSGILRRIDEACEDSPTPALQSTADPGLRAGDSGSVEPEIAQ